MENKFQRGIALYLSIMIMGILLAISLGVSTILFGQIRMIRGMGDSVMAFFAADTGIERALYEPQPTLSGSFDGSSYQVTVKCSPNHPDCPSGFEIDPDCLAPYFCYKSVGKFKEVRRAIEVER
ncbi:MAG: pilus assembly PilX N-terminal domain-containing protein [Patescibacteria group bacterium]|nr:pilus assembly PilX N-terminal domain-containing protein [Patescibacteria group bacterium]